MRLIASFGTRPEFVKLAPIVAELRRNDPAREVAVTVQPGVLAQGDPGLLRLDPRWHQAAARFVVEGFKHIPDGIDHLLFIACLIIPFRRFAPLVVIVTAFTVAHSITLIAAAFGHVPDGLWFPPLVEMLIAVSIVYMALENIVGSNLRRRWLIAFAFGLIHGFGFSFALRESFWQWCSINTVPRHNHPYALPILVGLLRM